MAPSNSVNQSTEIVPDGLNQLWDAGNEAKVELELRTYAYELLALIQP
jgi:hypothetical protein